MTIILCYISSTIIYYGFVSVLLLRGPSGELRPAESYVTATFNVETRFTRFDLGQNMFSLIPYGSDSVRITTFRLKVDHICGDGSPLTVTLVYYSDGQEVCFASLRLL